MDAEKNTILFTLIYQGETYPIQTYPNQYHSLMTLVSDKLGIPGFGLCCGMGSCGTCIVQIGNKHSAACRSVMACATMVNDSLANTIITLPDKIY